ncbi:MAG TPA: aromatic acid exporter family protein [Atopostipes sp.]|nr:aromatic acid exporter family protein [Atopostipes sp.]
MVDRERIVPGLRIVKTALSVFICLQLFYFFDYPQPIYAVLACILTMKETSTKTKTHGLNRLLGTLICALMSYLCLMSFTLLGIDMYSGWMPLFVSGFMLLALTVCKWFNFDPYVFTIAAVVTTMTLLTSGSSQMDAFEYVATRTIETIIGFIIAYLVNRYFFAERTRSRLEE